MEISGTFSPLSEFGHPVQQVIMPIITKFNGQLIPCGTGFIINRDGLMMTAAHVLTYAESHKVRQINQTGNFYDHLELYALYITNEKHGDQNKYIRGGLWPIDRAWLVNEIDIGFCWLRPATLNEERVFFPVVKLSPGIPKIGEKILGFGYYNSKAYIEIIDNKLDNSFDPIFTHKVEYSQDTAFTQGEILEIYPIKRDNSMLTFPCFYTNARFEHGMSGGPIFNQDGTVCGVICSAQKFIDDENSYISYGSLLWPSMSIHVEAKIDTEPEMKKFSIYDLINRGFISVDESFQNISVTNLPNGKLEVSICSDLQY